MTELEGVVEVVPDAVEATDDGGLRGHEGVTHPDGENGILLAECLPSGDSFVMAPCLLAIPAPDHASERKLCGTAE